MIHGVGKLSAAAPRRQSQSLAPVRRAALACALAGAAAACSPRAPAAGPAGTASAPPATVATPATPATPAADTAAANDAAPRQPADVRPEPRVRLGVDVLLRDSVHLVRGRRVGLVTNHTGVSWPDGTDHAVSTIDRLNQHPDIELVALFSPEHGIRGSAEAGEKVASDVDPATGLPIHSLYGETRKPTPEMLDGVDVLLFDIQDIGTRYYTYVWTMALAMEAAGEAGIPFIVLDRPNPLGGRLMQGNVLRPGFETFVGLYPVPMRHGLTAGELARYLVAEHGLDVELRVARMEGWDRADWYDETGLPFVPPSPNMPSLESAAHYPGTCLFEGTNVSVGRGTDRAFQQIGAPWLDADRLVARLAAGPHPGVRIEAVEFVPRAPGDGKFGGETVRGVRFTVLDRMRYDPTVLAVAALMEIRRLHPDRLEWRPAHFDRLAGSDRLRRMIEERAGLAEITDPWPVERAGYADAAKDVLLYP